MSDVCLLVEGAYPYVRGGVSNWLHELIKNLPNRTFSLVHVGARPDSQRKALYDLPPNVVEFHEIFLNDTSSVRLPERSRQQPASWQHFQALHEAIAALHFESEIGQQRLTARV